LKFASLFTGAGGFDLGLEQAGLTPVFQCEFEKNCQSVLRKHWPDVHLEEDVRNARGDFLRELGTDVLTGGFPCQDLSMAGHRKGLDGDRSGLWFEFHRIIKEAGSIKFILIENVCGLLSSNEGRDMAVVLRGLEELGYEWEFRVLNSAYFGIPQRRRRVFICASLPDTGDRSRYEILLKQASLSRDPKEDKGQKSTYTQELRDSIRSGTPIPGPKAFMQDFSEQLNYVNGHGQVTTTLMSCSSGHVANYVHHDIVPTLNASGAGTARTGGQAAEQYFFVGSPARRLTPRECERLQGFPDDWTLTSDSGSIIADSHRYKMMGNAVSVPVAKWIGERLLEAVAK
tara:strand:+ start:1561 stop:2589 length:1029 start_codon:yes stop_codon:yes gene_type:complete